MWIQCSQRNKGIPKYLGGQVVYGFVAATGATPHIHPITWKLLVFEIKRNTKAQWCKVPNSLAQVGFPTESLIPLRHLNNKIKNKGKILPYSHIHFNHILITNIRLLSFPPYIDLFQNF